MTESEQQGKEEGTMNTSDIRRISGASHATIHGWIKRGELRPLPENTLGLKRPAAYRFKAGDVLAFLGISEDEARRRLAENPKPRK